MLWGNHSWSWGSGAPWAVAHFSWLVIHKLIPVLDNHHSIHPVQCWLCSVNRGLLTVLARSYELCLFINRSSEFCTTIATWLTVELIVVQRMRCIYFYCSSSPFKPWLSPSGPSDGWLWMCGCSLTRRDSLWEAQVIFYSWPHTNRFFLSGEIPDLTYV